MKSKVGKLVKIFAINSEGEKHCLIFNSIFTVVKNEKLLLRKFQEYFEGTGWKLITKQNTYLEEYTGDD